MRPSRRCRRPRPRSPASNLSRADQHGGGRFGARSARPGRPHRDVRRVLGRRSTRQTQFTADAFFHELRTPVSVILARDAIESPQAPEPRGVPGGAAGVPPVAPRMKGSSTGCWRWPGSTPPIPAPPRHGPARRSGPRRRLAARPQGGGAADPDRAGSSSGDCPRGSGTARSAGDEPAVERHPLQPGRRPRGGGVRPPRTRSCSQ